MISYRWTLSAEQSLDKKAIFELQTHLAAVGVYLDLSLNDNAPQLLISVSENVLQEEESGDIVQSSSDDEETLVSPAVPIPKKRRGRPQAAPINDITLEHVRHMRFMGVPAEEIAKEIGISRRTFFRILLQIEGKNLAPKTPFSKWR